MSKRLTTEEFIEKSKQIHNDKYNYSKVEYINNHTKVCIICPEHGEFEQLPLNHLKGKGCSKCSGNDKLSLEEFVKRARQVHCDKYDYSKVDYKNADTKVCIICPEHGEFYQTPYKHVNSEQGCPFCSGRIDSTKMFINKANSVHNNKYDYSKTNYTRGKDKVIITCTVNGDFEQTAREHLNGNGCPKCGGTNKLAEEYIIEKCKEVHGNKYDYSKSIYDGVDKKMLIVCHKHGEFYQTPWNHIRNKQGCPYCNESHLELSVNNCLKDLGLAFERQKKFDWLGRQSLDFYILDYDAAIECQGIQHFKPCTFGGITYEKAQYNFEHLKELDSKKKKLCEDNGIKLAYINYDETDLKNKILNLINK